ncbi:hypothetical protein AX14_008172 [Amanita brunnescens Koide BX004]|nr:hypothetical protein AX14_008172 [Amanita brunnescens Koide BX004]
MQLSLRHFVLRQQAILLYRHIVRASRAIPDPLARRETVAFFRAEFDRNRHLLDLDAIENKLKAARREVKLILPLAH